MREINGIKLDPSFPIRFSFSSDCMCVDANGTCFVVSLLSIFNPVNFSAHSPVTQEVIGPCMVGTTSCVDNQTHKARSGKGECGGGQGSRAIVHMTWLRHSPRCLLFRHHLSIIRCPGFPFCARLLLTSCADNSSQTGREPRT